jgi:hypothetical protein
MHHVAAFFQNHRSPVQSNGGPEIPGEVCDRLDDKPCVSLIRQKGCMGLNSDPNQGDCSGGLHQMYELLQSVSSHMKLSAIPLADNSTLPPESSNVGWNILEKR